MVPPSKFKICLNVNLHPPFEPGDTIPYLFAYKPISAISRDPKLFHVSSCCIEIKNKHKTFGYKPRPNNCKVLHACR